MSQLPVSAFQAYDPNNYSAIVAGPDALYSVSVDSLLPTQLNEGFTEVDKKADGFNDLTSLAAVESSLLADIEPVVIGPDGKLYLTDGHHTFTALEDSAWGASNPTVYVNVIANYSNLTEAQFFATMQSNNLLLPLNDNVPETVNDSTGAPIPTSLTSLTSDVYRGLEYSILKNKNSKLFATNGNITGAIGTSTPGLDKMTGFYSDFLEAAAYQNANGGLGLSYLSAGDIALASQWNLTGANLTTLPNISSPVHVYQLPGYILSQNLVESSFASGGISNATLANGALDGNGTFTGITQINAGNAASGPILIGTPNVGFIMQLGADNKDTVTLSGGGVNTYTGGTSILAGTLIITDDTSLGAATPANATVNPSNVKSSVQADNGIIFNSLTEGNGTLQIGTTAGGGTSTFTTNRPIAVGGEAATINLNGYKVTLTGQLISLGTNGTGIGNATGYSDLTIDDNSSNNGILYLSTASPYFYGNLVIGNAESPTVNVTSDAALGNTAANNTATGVNNPIGQVELNGGTLQMGASFSATDRNLFLGSGSTFDVDGNTTSWGSLSDTQRTLTFTNSSSTAGAVSFTSFNIASSAILALSGKETVTFTNGIVRSGTASLILQAPTLGTTEQVLSGMGATSLVNGIAQAWIVTNSGAASGKGPYDFATYGSAGYVTASYTGTFGASNVVALSATTTTLSANAAAYALNTEGKALALGTHTLTIGDGTSADAAGLILASGSAISNGTLAFGGSEGEIWLSGTSSISAAITGSDGLTFSGSGTVSLSAAETVSGPITIDSGTVSLTGTNIFSSDVSGVLLQDTKSKPSAAVLNISSNNQFATLNSAGSNSSIGLSGGAILTIGDSNNLSSTLSSTITETGAATAGALTKAGTGLLDLSGMGSGGLNLIAGSTVAVQGGALRIAGGIFKNTNVVTLASGTELQYSGNGGSQFGNAITGAGTFHLLAGTVQLTSTANTYTGGTVIESGATLDVTTANLPTGGNIVNAGGILDFDQTTSGTFSGVMSNGLEAGGPNDPNTLASTAHGPSMSGTLIKDDSTGANSGNVTIGAVQTFTGATYIEAGTLTLGVANAIADSSGVTLGRVGTTTTATLALGVNNTLASLSSDPGSSTVIESTSVTLNGHVLTLAPAIGVSSSFGGVISDGTAAGSVVADGTGTVTLTGSNTFTGGVTIASGTLELGNAQAAGTGAITFAAQVDPTLQIDGTTMPTNKIDGFNSSDVIDLASIANQSGSAANFNYTTNVLTVSEGTSTYQLQFDPTQSFAGDYFDLAPDASSTGTDITESTTACYCRGTLILTDEGEVLVETLAIGDRVITASGETRPIKWVGKRSYGGRFLLGRKDVLPICIKAGAIEDHVPKRDLWISPHHAMLIDGLLVEGKDLVNGVTIVQAGQIERVDYFHIELETHDALMAEGAASETFIDDDSRGIFHNAHEFAQLFPDAAGEALALYCAPRIEDGPKLDRLRLHLDQRAGIAVMPRDNLGGLRGQLDNIDGRMVYGWAQNIEHPSVPVCLDVMVDGMLVAQTLANTYRKDLAAAGIGTGAHAFAVALPPQALAPDVQHIVEIRRSADGEALRNSPRIIHQKRNVA